MKPERLGLSRTILVFGGQQIQRLALDRRRELLQAFKKANRVTSDHYCQEGRGFHKNVGDLGAEPKLGLWKRFVVSDSSSLYSTDATIMTRLPEDSSSNSSQNTDQNKDILAGSSWTTNRDERSR